MRPITRFLLVGLGIVLCLQFTMWLMWCEPRDRTGSGGRAGARRGGLEVVDWVEYGPPRPSAEEYIELCNKWDYDNVLNNYENVKSVRRLLRGDNTLDPDIKRGVMIRCYAFTPEDHTQCSVTWVQPECKVVGGKVSAKMTIEGPFTNMVHITGCVMMDGDRDNRECTKYAAAEFKNHSQYDIRMETSVGGVRGKTLMISLTACGLAISSHTCELELDVSWNPMSWYNLHDLVRLVYERRWLALCWVCVIMLGHVVAGATMLLEIMDFNDWLDRMGLKMALFVCLMLSVILYVYLITLVMREMGWTVTDILSGQAVRELW
ncbi:membrane protein A46 [Aotine betaherpesvirus 1]|uniref:Membrane protein A46 n=1 Tax=Aotine betaherpesvirus 1 TaxID=50290 RepID=G8XUM4_9BETA|nr:membrane protein A46 [Aotine betaherpesvirus 1]AEV80866.1 membrane protein A46 [Aotine betaherpesvirus 1]